MTMLTAERKKMILDVLEADGKVLVAELSRRFGVSEDTIRRDLRDLHRAGLLERAHGGALPRPPVCPAYTVRLDQSTAAKRAIAAATIPFLAPSMLVAIDAGTSTLAVAEQIPADLHLTVVTHSLPAALVLCEHPTVDVIVVGGALFKSGRGAIGAGTVEGYRRVRPDVCILGVAGAHAEIGLTTLDPEEAIIKRVMVEQSATLIALAAAEKLGTAAAHIFAPMDRVDRLVTDSSAAREAVQEIQEQGVDVVIAR
jgi:DeoR/GlpR family transcriptional regulator of sugar metabolism